jgi:hypothetical protein
LANVYAIANGNWSAGATWNTGVVPTSADDVFTNNFTVNMDVNATVISLRNTASTPIVAGGSFNFNTAGVTVSATSTSASLSAGATNLITVTATTGTVTLNLGSSVTGLGTSSTQIFNYTGNCNFTLSGTVFNGGSATNAVCIAKSSTGVITINGDLRGGSVAAGYGLSSTNGNTIINGNSLNTVAGSVLQTAGNLTITGIVSAGSGNAAITLSGAASVLTVDGNVTGGTAANIHGINFTGTSGTVTGNILGGRNATAYGVNATGTLVVNGNVTGDTGNGILTTTTLTVTGTVQGGPVAAIASTSANTINVTGDVYASATANGISSTNASGVVNLTGNMYNGLGRNAIYCQNVFISNTATTLWRMDTGGGNYKFLYSADTTPNLPPITDVRFGTTFGPALSLTGTMVVLANSDVRKDVPNDNSVGTAELTSADIISGINASSDSLAVRLKNALTDVTAGNIISQYKDS